MGGIRKTVANIGSVAIAADVVYVISVLSITLVLVAGDLLLMPQQQQPLTVSSHTMKHLTTLTLLLSVFACRGPEAKNRPVLKDIISSSNSLKLSPTSVENKKKTYIIKEDVLDNLLNFPSVGEDIKRVNLPSFELKKIPETNIHDPSIIDTIYQFENKSGNFTVYKASDKYILFDFLINGNSFTFQNGLKLGLSQLDLLKTFKIKAPKSDTVALGDLEQNSVVNFIFKSDKLVEVNYDGYLD